MTATEPREARARSRPHPRHAERLLQEVHERAHARPYDFPERDDDAYLRHTIVKHVDGIPQLSWKPVTVTKWQPKERTY